MPMVVEGGVDKLTTMVKATNLGMPEKETKRSGKRPKGSSVAHINNGGLQSFGPSSKASTSTSKGIGNPGGINGSNTS